MYVCMYVRTYMYTFVYITENHFTGLAAMHFVHNLKYYFSEGTIFAVVGQKRKKFVP